MSTNQSRPTPTNRLVWIGVIAGLAVAVGVFLLGADQSTSGRFAGLAQLAFGLAVVIGGGWAALRRK